MIEPETPVRLAALRRRRVGGLSFVDGWQPAPEQHLAAKVELLSGFVAGIDSARLAQPLELARVEVESLGLTNDPVWRQAEPFEIVADRAVELGRRALAVGVVDAQDERP